MKGDSSKKTISSIESLMMQSHVLDIVKKIHDLTGTPQEHFNIFYLSPIKKFINLTQHCNQNEVSKHFYSVIKILKFRRSLILPPDSDPENINEKKDLWTYSTFIGSLMYNSSLLICKKILVKHNLNTYRWCPFMGELQEGSKIEIIDDYPSSNHLNSTLIPIIFDNKCLTWIYGDSNAFNTALELAASPNQDSRLGQAVLKFHDNKTKELYRVEDNTIKPSTNMEIPIEAENDDENQDTGEAFCTWLYDKIHDNSLGDYICETPDGLTISDPAIFKHYSKIKNRTSWEDIKEQFLKSSKHSTSHYKVTFPNNTKSSAIIIDKSHLLPK